MCSVGREYLNVASIINKTIINFQLIAILDIIFSLIIYNGKDHDKAAFKSKTDEVD